MDDEDEELFIERVAGNPIHAYRLMKRLYFDWQTIENDVMNDDWKSMQFHMYKTIFKMIGNHYVLG